MAADHEDGQSVAAWTTVGFLLVGAALICFGIGFGILWLDIVGIVVCAVGLVAGKVLAMAGFGVDRPEPPRSTSTEAPATEAPVAEAPVAEAPQAHQQTQE